VYLLLLELGGKLNGNLVRNEHICRTNVSSVNLKKFNKSYIGGTIHFSSVYIVDGQWHLCALTDTNDALSLVGLGPGLGLGDVLIFLILLVLL
jgi:hypothetical protein